MPEHLCFEGPGGRAASCGACQEVRQPCAPSEARAEQVQAELIVSTRNL